MSLLSLQLTFKYDIRAVHFCNQLFRNVVTVLEYSLQSDEFRIFYD